ncbi:aminoglycoside phosphotransferase family protein [Spirosoma sp. SC4-14]|uniref:aminoglycoside phosphotransferase family protein n=1 Tax=Spirosoma sp. SC4-14 TaxID=3128900 RepID=UPI0030CBE2BC
MNHLIPQLWAFLQASFHPLVRNVRPLGAGMFSEAYRFETEDGIFVVRIGVTREAFEKDLLAYARLAHSLPVPEIRQIGEFDRSRFYCISRWLPGKVLTALNKEQTERLLPDVFKNLLTMSRVAVPPETEFGILNGSGQSRKPYKTWADFVCAIDDFPTTFTPRGDEHYRPWQELYTDTFLDKSIVDDACQRLTAVRPFLPNERHYVHGDFGHDNALADSNHLTAILDWAELRCGDWLYDLVYLAYHDTFGVDYIGTFRQWANAQGLLVPNLMERVTASFLSIFLGNIFLEANRNQRDWYEEDVDRYRTFFLIDA